MSSSPIENFNDISDSSQLEDNETLKSRWYNIHDSELDTEANPKIDLKKEILKETSNFKEQCNNELVGYIAAVSPAKMSGNKNQYCDTLVNIGGDNYQSVRVMLNQNTKRTLFTEKSESSSPVKMANLSSAGKMTFFNSNLGSRIIEYPNIDFKYQKKETHTVADVKMMGQNQIVNLTGNIEWLEETRTVYCGKNKSVPRLVRTGLLADDTGSIKISVWQQLINDISEDTTLNCYDLTTESYNGVRLATIPTTKFSVAKEVDVIYTDWKEYDIAPQVTKICCPFIDTVKVDTIHQCINIDCKKKVTFFPGENTVTCNNCKRKMLVKRCTNSMVAEMTLTDKDDETKHYQITMFNIVLSKMVKTAEQSNDQIVDAILFEENWDFTINKK